MASQLGKVRMAVVDQLDVVIPHRRAPHRRGSMVIAWIVWLGILLAVICWAMGLPDLHHAGPGAVAALTAQLAGLVASVLVCLQLLLIARVPWLVNTVGLASMVAWHRVVGTAVLILIIAHVVLAVLGGMLLDRQTAWSQLIMTLGRDRDLLQAIIGTVLIVGAGLSSARVARSRLRYEWWYAVHVSVYLGIYLSFAHQVNSGVHFVGSVAMRAAWTSLYVLTAFVIVVGRVIVPWSGFLSQRVRVDRVVPETTDVASVWLTGSRLHRLRVRPGQFFFVRFITPGHVWSAHPYSVSLLPSRGRMRFTIGGVGDHSRRTRQLKPGTRVLLEGPYGSFCATRSTVCGVLLIAGGSGIGPILALARELCRRGRDVVVIQRASSDEQLPLRDEVAGLELRFVPVIGRRSELGHDPLRPESLRELVPDVGGREAFVCGSAGLVRSTSSALRTLGVPAERIHREQLVLT
jgi:predicted ferric reductase